MSFWDVRWDGITIAVRATGPVNSYSTAATAAKARPGWTFKKTGAWADDGNTSDKTLERCRTTVVALAHHDATKIGDGWTFYVLPGSMVNDLAGARISVKAATALVSSYGGQPAGPKHLSGAITDAASRHSPA